MPRKSDEERLRELDERQAQIRAQRQQIKAKQEKKSRADQLRKTFIVGELFLKHGGDMKWLQAVAAEHVKTPGDRALFGLPAAQGNADLQN